jgi:uncharacterized membrane protein (UPF0127 family)
MRPEGRPGKYRQPTCGAVFALTFSLCALLQSNAAPAVESRAAEAIESYPQSALEIRSSQGRQWFNIRIADSAARQEQGLMFVRSLPADEGMLFPQARPRVMAFWMKNTVIPLDILFITARGRIACLREQARPLSLDLIGCDQPVKAVLEIGGGEAAKRGIRVGDLVRHAVFRR